MWELFLKVKNQYTLTDIAKTLNVAIGTVRRWIELQSVPESYQFDLMKMAGEEIDYTVFSYKDKDQFFTPDILAKRYCELVYNFLSDFVNLDDYIFVEPSAGAGVFLQYLPSNTLAFDIEKLHSNVIQQDFLEWNDFDLTKKYIVIGNPPFGLRGQKALQFINKAFTFADFVCFILPPLFNSDGKGSPKKRINQN